MLLKFRINEVLGNLFGVCFCRSCPERQAIMEAKKLFKNKKIVACEIGTFEGKHAYQMLKHLNVERIYLVDPYEEYEDYKKDNSCEKVNIAKKKALNLLKPFGKKIVWIKKYSNDAIKDIPEALDFLYIDGNHYSPYINRDLENYYPLVKEGGIISGHDYVEEWRDVIDAVNQFALKINKKVVFGKGTDWIIFK